MLLKTPHSKSNTKVEGKDLVGSRIRVWWPLDKKYVCYSVHFVPCMCIVSVSDISPTFNHRFYNGTVQDYDEKLKKHMVCSLAPFVMEMLVFFLRCLKLVYTFFFFVPRWFMKMGMWKG